MIVFRLLVLVMTLVLGACDTAADTSDYATEEATSTGTPTEEGTGPENPRPTDDGMAVTLPELPVGGGSNGEPADQCATASFTSSLPDGVSVRVTGIRFSADGASVDGGGCDGNDFCDGFVFDSPGATCSVSVDASNATTGVDMSLAGECVAEDVSACDDLRNSSGSVELNVPQTSDPDETTTTEDEPLPSQTE
ncbi:hypothetical protein [Actinophytocola oryzae]|uniref:Neocarzinostatin family protein n=1 Tax=Actinophytocola oryzae TaxID=502181 RepID=A0A4R7W376_9PSEU|nr:hypothetical protein [Actinophytocola oryzae]TDV56615.1 hypothetical protein CLV71_102682 [Actinophytocola oryzae]